MNRVITAGVITVGLILSAHELATIGGRLPMVFVALWFGSTTMVAMIFASNDRTPGSASREHYWRQKMRTTLVCLAPFTLVPLLESHGVGNDPAVWLLDCALYIAVCTVPYFTLVGRTVVGGVALSMGAFQLLWTCGASVFFVIMEHLETAKGGHLAHGAAFEEFFRPEYRYLFFRLCALMLLGYCPALFWLGRRRFLRQMARASAATPSTDTT